jgi:hypothetical protein
MGSSIGTFRDPTATAISTLLKGFTPATEPHEEERDEPGGEISRAKRKRVAVRMGNGSKAFFLQIKAPKGG